MSWFSGAVVVVVDVVDVVVVVVVVVVVSFAFIVTSYSMLRSFICGNVV